MSANRLDLRISQNRIYYNKSNGVEVLSLRLLSLSMHLNDVFCNEGTNVVLKRLYPFLDNAIETFCVLK